MEETYHVGESVQGDSVQSVQQQSTSATTVEIPVKGKNKSENFSAALNVTGIAMAAIFAFMLVFYFVIKGIDRYFPEKETK